MKLNKEDKAMLTSMGHPEKDFQQIEVALQKRITKYKLGNTTISREEAIRILGREVFISGIARSAFHYTAAQQTADGQIVYFDSSKLFK